MTDLLHQELWIKAKLFTNRGLEASRPADERRLWASLALELLGKAALARHAPVLIAIPNESGRNLLMAAGLIEGGERRQTLPAKAVFTRCSLAFKPFNAKEAERIAQDRNEYLHGGGLAVPPIPEEQWWAKYWTLVDVLTHAQSRTLEDLVGPDHVDDVEAKLALNRRLIQNRAEMLISRSKQTLQMHRQGTNTASVQMEWDRDTPRPLGLDHHTVWACPACTADGVLEGHEVGEVHSEWEQVDEDDYEHHIWLEVFAEAFTCATCHLRVRDEALFEAMGLPPLFEAEGSIEDLGPELEYGND